MSRRLTSIKVPDACSPSRRSRAGEVAAMTISPVFFQSRDAACHSSDGGVSLAKVV